MSNASPPTRVGARSMDARKSTVVIKAVGRKLAPYEDFYHWVLTLSWSAFFGWVTVAYMLTNVLFGAAYYLLAGSVANTTGFLDCFFFSVETFATIGYGEMTPVGRAGHALMTGGGARRHPRLRDHHRHHVCAARAPHGKGPLLREGGHRQAQRRPAPHVPHGQLAA